MQNKYILNKKTTKKKRKLCIYIQCRFSVNWNDALQFLFMSNYRKVFRALKMNVTTKGVKLKCTDQFDSRRGQNWKYKFKVHFEGSNFAQVTDRPLCKFHFLNTFHMRKIYTGIYLYIYVNILRYVKRGTSEVILCSHEFYRQEIFQLTSVFSW